MRFSVVFIKDHIDTPKEAEMMIKKASEWGVEQISLRPVAAPEESESEKYKTDTLNLMLTPEKIAKLNKWAEKRSDCYSLTDTIHGYLTLMDRMFA